MSLRTTISLALLALVSFAADSALAAKPATPDAVIAGSKGEERINISFDDKHVYVDVGDKQLMGESHSIKRFWRRGPGGEAVAEVKSGDDGFKIRTPADKLILKVKVTADKIKIADNEEMQNAWSIKFKANENAKVFDAKEKQVGAVKFAADTGKIKIKDAADKDLYVVESGKRSNSYGALLLKDVPEEYRRILLGELFVRGL